MSIRIVVQLTPAASRSVHGARTRRDGSGVLDSIDRPLAPMHPGASDDTLRTFFQLDVPDAGEAAELLERLQRDPAVAAAYVKPDDEPPM